MDHPTEGLAPARARRKSRPGPRLRPAAFADYQQINQLGARFGLKNKSYQEWSDLWLANPVYREVRAWWDIGWVIEDERGRIVGSVGNIPVSYEIGGTTLLAGASHAWVAEPDYRSAALILLDSLTNQRNVDLFVTTTNSAASTPAMAALRCARVPSGLWDESAFWITDYCGFLKSYLALRRLPTTAPGSPHTGTVSVRGLLRGLRGKSGAVDVEPCPDFDDRFDVFWKELTQRNPNMLLAVRTRAVLQWHYRHHLLNDRLWIAAAVDGLRLLGYAVFLRSDRPAIGLKRVFLVDFQSLDEGSALLLPLLSWAYHRCRAEGIHLLEYYGRWLEPGEVVDASAPFRRTLPSWVFLYRANEPDVARRLTNPDVWCPTLYDGDASLVL